MAREGPFHARPRCPHCEARIGRGRLRCPRCRQEWIEADRLDHYRRRATEWATAWKQTPWSTSSDVLPYVQRSAERGFHHRFAPRWQSGWEDLARDIRAEFTPPLAQLLLEHLVDDTIRAQAPALAALLRRRRPPYSM